MENKTIESPNFDKIMKKDLEQAKNGHKVGFDSNIELRNKTFMKISDVDKEDAEWFKDFADKHTDRKQFLALKVIRQVMERLDPLVSNVVKQLNQMDERINAIEAGLNVPEEEDNKVQIPKTQGSAKR